MTTYLFLKIYRTPYLTLDSISGLNCGVWNVPSFLKWSLLDCCLLTRHLTRFWNTDQDDMNIQTNKYDVSYIQTTQQLQTSTRYLAFKWLIWLIWKYIFKWMWRAFVVRRKLVSFIFINSPSSPCFFQSVYSHSSSYGASGLPSVLSLTCFDSSKAFIYVFEDRK